MNLTVAMRVIGGFTITACLLAFLGINSVFVLNGISESTEDVNKVSVPALESTARLQQKFLLMSKTTLLDYYAQSYEEIDASAAQFKNQASDFAQEFSNLKSIVSGTPVLANQLPKVNDGYEDFHKTAVDLFASKKASLQLADKISETLEETEFAADDAATYALDLIDLNNLNYADPAVAKVASSLEGKFVSVISAATDIAKEKKRINVETIIKELEFTTGAILETKQQLAAFENKGYEGFSDLMEQVDAVVDLLQSGSSVAKVKVSWLDQIDKTDNLLASTNKKIDMGIASLGSLSENVKAQLEVTTGEVTEDVDTGVSRSIYTIVFSLIISIFIAFQTVIRVTRPLAEVNKVLNVVSTGDLTQRLDDSAKDEFGVLASNCNKLIDNLKDLIHGIVNRSNQLATASEETSMVVKESTVAINDQRSQVEQAATATTEMASTSSAVMERANEALSDIKHADEEAERVKQISDTNKQTIIQLASEIDQAAGVIDEVNHHSAAIGGILDVIRGIAEQTNLLALNAAIEAARAGEQGRGFAVVADEVRSLASKTQESTQEIQNMIEQLQRGSKSAVTVMNNSKSQADLCVEQTEQATIALNGITDSVHQASDMSEQIVTAANEQNQVSNEISERLESIVAIAEETAAGSAQTAQSSQEVARLAEELRHSVEQFKL
jgi:methyl-accepting chemotaxis protein